jgi:uncharacterized SAM-binding protein YcdF (DUF218 family)
MRKITLLSLLVATIAVVPERTLPFISSILVVDQVEELQDSDAIIVLLGGGPERVVRASQLYKEGYAPRIVLGSGFRPEHPWSAIPQDLPWPYSSEIYQDALVYLGVSTEDLIEVDTSEGFDTDGELRRISSFAKQSAWEKVILVSSASHTRRVGLIWSRISDIEQKVVAAPIPGFSEWWRHGEHCRRVAYEYGALSKEMFRQAIYYAKTKGLELFEKYRKQLSRNSVVAPSPKPLP